MWHHQKEGYHAGGMRAPHYQGVCLCERHHMGKYGVHLNRAHFERHIGMSEGELVALSQKMFNWKPGVTA